MAGGRAGQPVVAKMAAMHAGDYLLSKDSFWFWAGYTVTDGSGAAVMHFATRLAVRVRFDAIDGQGRVLLSGRGQLLMPSNHLAFTSGAQPVADLQARWQGERRFVLTCRSGDLLETQGALSAEWELRRGETAVARVDRRGGHRWGIALLDGTQGELTLSCVMGIVRLTLIDERGLSDG